MKSTKKRRAPITSTLMSLVLLASAACGAGQKRLDALEARVQELERRDAQTAELQKQLQGMQESIAAHGEQIESFGEVVDVFRRILEMQAEPDDPAEPDAGVVYSVPVDGSPFEGPADAKVTIVKAFEFACPFCERTRPTLRQIRERYGKDVRVVYKNFIVHTDVAEVPARAACAAQAQGKFSAMKDAIWDQGFLNGRKLSVEDMRAIARNVGLNMRRFRSDMDGDACAQRVRDDQAMLGTLGVRGTPTFFINGRLLVGAQPLPSFTELIDEELAKANHAIAEQGIAQGAYYEHLVKTGQKSQ